MAVWLTWLVQATYRDIINRTYKHSGPIIVGSVWCGGHKGMILDANSLVAQT